MTLIESAVGIEAVGSIACRAGTSRLAFGSGDYRRDTGIADDALGLAYPRSRLTAVAVNAALAPTVDDVAAARGILARGATPSDPSDVPRRAQARRTLDLAHIYSC